MVVCEYVERDVEKTIDSSCLATKGTKSQVALQKYHLIIHSKANRER